MTEERQTFDDCPKCGGKGDSVKPIIEEVDMLTSPSGLIRYWPSARMIGCTLPCGHEVRQADGEALFAIVTRRVDGGTHMNWLPPR